MYCQTCGNQLHDDVAFCPKCGTKVGYAPQKAPSTGDNSSSGTLNKSTAGKICIGIAAVLLIGALFTYAGDKSDYNDSYGCDGYDYDTDYLSEHEKNVIIAGVFGLILLGVGIYFVNEGDKDSDNTNNASGIEQEEWKPGYATKIPMANEYVCCSRCGKVQNSNRTTCENCGATFEE